MSRCHGHGQLTLGICRLNTSTSDTAWALHLIPWASSLTHAMTNVHSSVKGSWAGLSCFPPFRCSSLISTRTCANAQRRDTTTQWDHHQPGDWESQGTHMSSCGPQAANSETSLMVSQGAAVQSCKCRSAPRAPTILLSLPLPFASSLSLVPTPAPGNASRCFRICFWRESRLNNSSASQFLLLCSYFDRG